MDTLTSLGEWVCKTSGVHPATSVGQREVPDE
jgi:hypothetical protein